MKIFISLMKTLKNKMTHHKTKPKQKTSKKHKTHIPLAFSPLLFCCSLMLVLLSSSSSFVLESDCFHMSHHLKSKFTINLLNGTITRLPTRLSYTETKLEAFF